MTARTGADGAMPGLTTIVLSGVRARGHHGVLPSEKEAGQEFVVDVEYDVDAAAAAAADDLALTVSYADVAAEVVQRVQDGALDLVETLAARILADVVRRPFVERAGVTVHKPQAPVGVPFGDVSVSLEAPGRHPVVIALGSNLGDRRAVLEDAIARLSSFVTVTGRSAWFETDPVGGVPQPDYLNAVVVGTTALGPTHLMRRLHEIEAAAGRTREVRWGARTLDLDLVQHGHPDDPASLALLDGDLVLPHPRAHERAFVLVPWLDADPRAALATGGRTLSVRELLEGLDASAVRALEDVP